MMLSIIIDHLTTKYGVSAEGNKKRQGILAELEEGVFFVP